MDIEERIEAAIERITCGFAPMRVPADGTDPDLVLADCLTEIRRLRAVAGPQIPEGYVLVPVVLPDPMLDVLYRAEGDMSDADMQSLWADILAARPEVP
ncbi:Uncharacterised protein [Stenotrophomonas maltophilia]|uniref:hypothetical protein n=1 Tax=Stenotrophomonas maltophilia TaxID=40324 RepID=UPI000DA2A960|nr:hypothetical protein [Stenotrophomonas maltophilia]SQG66923.1 Uncharacterised protein [Stenotrophomonas maltophilia]